MINFLQANWRILAEVLVLIFSVILFIVRKRPIKVVDTLKQFLSILIPQYVAHAEETIGPGNGLVKKDLVFQAIRHWCEINGFEFTEAYQSYTRDFIEAVLKCPQKKGNTYAKTHDAEASE